MSHKVFISILFIIGFITIIGIVVKGWDYYLLPLTDRVFEEEYNYMKPSGEYSHTLGVIGSSMIILGVALYSLRKRVKAFWNLGKTSYWLEFHIFLCLLGTILIVFHTTFKAQGIASISLWTMLAVASSGIVGRFLYLLIPRNITGNEISSAQILKELDGINKALKENGVTAPMIQKIDEKFAAVKSPKKLNQTFSAFIELKKAKKDVQKFINELIVSSSIPHNNAHKLLKLIRVRTSLIQKGLVMSQVEKLFFYWHAIHFPFTIIMFITFFAHVMVVVLIGYHWIF